MSFTYGDDPKRERVTTKTKSDTVGRLMCNDDHGVRRNKNNSVFLSTKGKVCSCTRTETAPMNGLRFHQRCREKSSRPRTTTTQGTRTMLKMQTFKLAFIFAVMMSSDGYFFFTTMTAAAFSSKSYLLHKKKKINVAQYYHPQNVDTSLSLQTTHPKRRSSSMSVLLHGSSSSSSSDDHNVGPSENQSPKQTKKGKTTRPKRKTSPNSSKTAISPSMSKKLLSLSKGKSTKGQKQARRPPLSSTSPLDRAREASKLLATVEAQYDSHSISLEDDGNGGGKEGKYVVARPPTNILYETALQAWATASAGSATGGGGRDGGVLEGPIQAEIILQRMEKLHVTPGYKHIHPTAECYSAVIRSYAKYNNYYYNIPPRISGSKAKSKSKSKFNDSFVSVDRAEDWLIKFEQEWKLKHEKEQKELQKQRKQQENDDSTTFSSIRGRQEQHPQEDWPTEVLLKCYNVCLDSWARWSNPSKRGIHASDRAYRLLQRLLQLQWQQQERELELSGNGDDTDISSSSSLPPILISPNTFSYVCVLKALASAGGKKNAQLSLSLLKTMEKTYAQNPLGPVKPNVVAYTSVIQAFANSGSSLSARGRGSFIGEKAALQCEKLLEKMATLYASGENDSVNPNAYTYQGVISAWAKSGTGVKGAKRAEAILKHCDVLYQSGNKSVKPLTISVNSVLEAWSVSGKGVQAAQHAESILQSLLPTIDTASNSVSISEDIQQKDGLQDVFPNTESINAVLTAWALSKHPNAAGKAEQLMVNFFDEVQKYNNAIHRMPKVWPNLNTYNIVIGAYTKQNEPRKAEALLYRLINDQKGTRVRPNAKSFGFVISCWAKSRERGSAERAEQLLLQMEKLYRNGNRGVQPNVIVYSAVIDAWSKSDQPNAALKAQSLFDRVLNEANASKKKYMYPNSITFNTILQAWANSNKPNAAVQAVYLLEQMEALYKSGIRDAKPTSRTLNIVLLCMAKNSKREPASSQQAEDLFERMLSLYIKGDKSMMPDSFTFSSCINAWAWNRNSANAGKGVLRLLRKMETLYEDGTISSKPHAICYNAATRFFVENRDPQRADDVLSMMETAFRRGNRDAKPDARTYFAVLNCYAQNPNKGRNFARRAMGVLARMQTSYSRDGNRAAKPNTRCYNTVLSALAKSSQKEASQQALQLLSKMKTLYSTGNNIDAKPDKISYSTAINALARAGGGQAAANKAMVLLTEMDELRQGGDDDMVPSLICFNAVLNTLSKAGTAEAAQKAEELLERMENVSSRPISPQSSSSNVYKDVRPDVISYTSVMNAWAFTNSEGAGERAEAVLRHMEALCDSGNKSVCPDTLAYNAVISAWTNSGAKGASQKADMILRNMERMHENGNSNAKPDGFSYRNVIVACAQQQSDDGFQQLERAQELLDFMETKYFEGDKNMKPDLLSYKSVANAWKARGQQGQQKVDLLAERLNRIYHNQA